jgi:type I restriction enzyme S subunit
VYTDIWVSPGFTPFLSGDLLVAKITPCFENGKIVQATIPHLVGFGFTEFHVVRPQKDKVDRRYLLHLLRQERIRRSGERRMTGSAGQRRVPEEFLASLPIPLPPLHEQRRIANILDKADDLRAKRRAVRAQLDLLTNAVFLDMFGDPVANPMRWPDPKVGGLLTFQQYGPRFFNESYSADGIRIVRITDLNESGTLDFSEMPRLIVSREDQGKYALRPGDLIFARSGATVGKVALIRSDDPSCIAGAYFITMRFASELTPVYARAVLAAASVRAIAMRRSRQAAQQNFSGPGLRSLPMPLPPVQLQEEFARRVAAIEGLEVASRRSLERSTELFSALQQRAFTGAL